MQTCFNPRPCGRSDDSDDGMLPGVSVFQSTPLREERHLKVFKLSHSELFQSTPLREERPPTAGVK